MFKKGDRVVYIPAHACRNPYHPDCEHGAVSSVPESGHTVFVKYDNLSMKMVSGDEPYTAKSTRLEDLVRELK